MKHLLCAFLASLSFSAHAQIDRTGTIVNDDSGGGGGLPFPENFNDPVFANVVTQGACRQNFTGTVTDASYAVNGGSDYCVSGATLLRVRVRNFNAADSMRWNGSGTFNWSWIYVEGDTNVSGDHYDSIQNFCASGTINFSNSHVHTIGTSNNTAGIFAADGCEANYVFTNVLFSGDGSSAFGLRLNADGAASIRFNHVYCLDNSFGGDCMLLANGAPSFGNIQVLEWSDVAKISIVGGSVVINSVIASPCGTPPCTLNSQFGSGD